jgi:hypothetical protein
MPIDTRRDPRLVAVLFADVIGSKAIADRDYLASRLALTARTLNAAFEPTVTEPFAIVAGDEIQGALADPAQAPLCLTVLRETLAPIRARATVAIGIVETLPASDRPRDPFAAAADNLAGLKRSGGLTSYSGTGPAGDILLNAICRLVDPLLEARSDKQWEAIAAYRRLGQQRAVADKLGVTRQSIGDRLAAGNWRATEDAAAAIAAYLSLICGT